MNITVKKPYRKVLVSSVYLVARCRPQIKTVSLNSLNTKNITQVQNKRSPGGRVIYEAEFESPITLKAGSTSSVEFGLSSEYKSLVP